MHPLVMSRISVHFHLQTEEEDINKIICRLLSESGIPADN